MFQVRRKRNDLMHTKTMQLTVVELSDIVQTMEGMLIDLHQRHGDPAAQRALTNIQQV